MLNKKEARQRRARKTRARIAEKKTVRLAIHRTNLHIYAAMRGQSLEDFQKTRNAQVLYSVAGNDDSKKTWDKPAARA